MITERFPCKAANARDLKDNIKWAAIQIKAPSSHVLWKPRAGGPHINCLT